MLVFVWLLAPDVSISADVSSGVSACMSSGLIPSVCVRVRNGVCVLV